MAWPCTGPACVNGDPWLKDGSSIGPRLGAATRCPTNLVESSPVFCGPGGELSVPKRSCQAYAFGVETASSGNPIIPNAIMFNGDFYTSPTPTSFQFEANTHACQHQLITAYWDPTATISLDSGQQPCYPIFDCQDANGKDIPQPDWYPPKENPFAACQLLYQWRTLDLTGAPTIGWTTILSRTIKDGDVFGSNNHESFTFLNLRSPGAPAETLVVRVVYTNTSTFVGFGVVMSQETSFLHGRVMYSNYCGPDEIYQTVLDSAGKPLANDPILATDKWLV